MVVTERPDVLLFSHGSATSPTDVVGVTASHLRFYVMKDTSHMYPPKLHVATAALWFWAIISPKAQFILLDGAD